MDGLSWAEARWWRHWCRMWRYIGQSYDHDVFRAIHHLPEQP